MFCVFYDALHQINKFLLMKKLIISCLVVFTMCMESCSSTKIVSSWREPGKEVAIAALNKVLVVALFKNETDRRKTEDEMVSYLHGKGVVSYNYLDADASKQNEEKIRDKIKANGFDGAVTMRLIDVDKENIFVPGNRWSYPNYDYSFSRYYFHHWRYYSDPGYYTTTKTYTVETNVFSIKEDKVIWTGLTETTNPDGVEKMTKEITKVLYDSMVKNGFINTK
jgi:hypothetical protein